MPDPDLEIGGGGRGGSGHPDLKIRGWPSLQKKKFSALRASVWAKNKGEPAPPGPSPGFVTVKWLALGESV